MQNLMLIQNHTEGDFKMHQEVKNLSVCFKKLHYRTFWYQMMYLFPKILQVFLGTLIISSNPYLSLFPLYSPPSKHEKTDAF